jgi:hypothetical protein
VVAGLLGQDEGAHGLVRGGSLNHYSKGAVIGFLHRYTAGLRPGDAPGYRDFRVEPVPGARPVRAAPGRHAFETSWPGERNQTTVRNQSL